VSVGDKPIDVEGFLTDIVADFGVDIIAGRGGFNGAAGVASGKVWRTLLGAGTFNVLPYWCEVRGPSAACRLIRFFSSRLVKIGGLVLICPFSIVPLGRGLVEILFLFENRLSKFLKK